RACPGESAAGACRGGGLHPGQRARDQSHGGALPRRPTRRRRRMRPDTIALMLAALPATAFVVLYLLEYRHVRPTPESKHLIGFTAILAAIILEELVRRFWLTDMPRQVHRAFV